MKPIREIVIREYLPGEFEVECDGRVVSAHSRGQMHDAVTGFTSSKREGYYVDGFQDGGHRPWEAECD